MSLSGQLSDLSLAELIEFFCNLRKTGRLKVEYPDTPGVFYFKEGELVDAQLGALSGSEAVYQALRLPSAAFDFNTHIYASRRTIDEPWMQLVLEGLRLVDEEGKPGGANHHEASANGTGTNGVEAPAGNGKKGEESIADVVAYMDDLYRLEDGTWAITSVANPSQPINVLPSPPPVAAAPTTPLITTPTSMAAPPASFGAAAGGQRRVVLLGAIGALLVCVVAVGAWTNWFGNKALTPVAPVAPPTQPEIKTSVDPAVNASLPAPTPEIPANSTESNPVGAAPGERAARPAPNRAASAAAKNPATADGAKPAATGSKTVMVQVMVDESGRVSQASVSNSRPGMESYESSAIRVARQRRYPPGKSGMITVPVKIN